MTEPVVGDPVLLPDVTVGEPVTTSSTHAGPGAIVHDWTVTAANPAAIASAVEDYLTANPPTTGRPAFWSGNGPPGTIVGAAVNDLYLDLDTYTLYTLGG